MTDLTNLERLLFAELEESYGTLHAYAGLQYLELLWSKLDLDDYLDILECLVDGNIDLDYDLLDLIDKSPVQLY